MGTVKLKAEVLSGEGPTILSLAEKVGWLPVWDQTRLREWRMAHSREAFSEPEEGASTSINGGVIIDRWCRKCQTSISHPHAANCPERVPELERLRQPEIVTAGGIMCGRDGCVHLTADDAAALLAAVDEEHTKLVTRYPTEESAIHALFDGWVRLKEMGWREAIYAPKNKPLELIEVGSTGIHRGYRDNIGFWIQDEDTWPSHPSLYRPALELEAR